jgi:hypothetical protein
VWRRETQWPYLFPSPPKVEKVPEGRMRFLG